MKYVFALALIVLGSMLIATPVVIRYLASINGFTATGDIYTACMFAGVGMVVAGMVFAFQALRSGGDAK